MAERAERLAGLSADKRALLMRRMASRPRADAGPMRLARGEGVNTFRMSFAQERLWSFEQLAGATAVHTVAGAFRLAGRVDVAALRWSVERVVARHESLRTTFVAVDGRPLQVVSPGTFVSVRITDLRTRPEHEAYAAITAQVEEAFDVAYGPLLRVRIHRVRDDLQLVCLTMHHLIADAWSVEIVVREIATLYRSRLAGAAPALPLPLLQYADFAEWQRSRHAGPQSAPLLAHWRRKLDGASYPRRVDGRPSFRGAARSRALPPALADGIRRLARAEGTTLFVVGLLVWKALLARRAGHSDVTVLSPVANRGHLTIADVVGFFVNLVALRTDLGAPMAVREGLARVHAVVRDALLHQDAPFEQVLSALGIERTSMRPPLSPFAFAVEQDPTTTIDLPGVDVCALPIDVTTSKTDLAMTLLERGAGIDVRIAYDTDRHAGADVDDLLSAFIGGIERAVEDPDRRVADLEPARLAVVASDALTEPPATVWSTFVAQAERTPGAVAVHAGARSLTYGALRARAQAIAGCLDVPRAGGDTIVAVWGARGIEWIAAMLGVWCRGAVYLPIDPRWPAARIADVLRASRARYVLTPTEPPAVLRSLDSGEQPWRLVAAGAPTVHAPEKRGHSPSPDELAYVMYTSGSSGSPKGALIEHGGLSNHLRAKIALLDLGPRDRVAQTASAGFDISLWQCLAPLAVGGSVAVIDDDVVRDPVSLRQAIAGGDVTVVELVPAVVQALLDAGDDVAAPSPGFGSMRWLVVTGEALPPSLCRRWLRRHPTVPLVNAYGPTECADDVTHHVITTPPAEGDQRVPIGRAIAGMTVYVLDESLRPLPPGTAGELCIGGIGVGRGYLYDPARTAAAFVTPDPFDGQPGTRLYRTGDRGRGRPDGTFEWLGRLDRQVKIRGTRVELEEVEAVLGLHPAVQEAAVVARPAESPTHLVAYVVGVDTAPDAGEAVRDFLAGRLPEAMVPSTLIPVTALPRTPHGKIDRLALSEASVSSASPAQSAAGARLPTTPAEVLLATHFAEVLGVAVPSTDADFFALGGDSLSTIRLVAMARRDGLVLTAQMVFEHRTVGALAVVATTATVPAAEQGPVIGPFPLTPIQRMLLAADLPEVHHYNMAMLVLVEPEPCPSALALAVEHVVRHHDTLRMRLRRDGGVWHARLAGLEGPVPYAHLDLGTRVDADARVVIEAAAAETQASLDLENGPILRVLSFDLGPARPGRVLVAVHHLACDAASWPILLEDLATTYARLRRGDAIALPPKTTSYLSWAHRLEEYAGAPDRERDRVFWERECAAGGTRLAREHDGPAAIAHIASSFLELASVDTEMLLATAMSGVTAESVLLTALVLAVTAGGGDDALVVYLERHGRESLTPDIDVSRTIGWFTAVFPVALQVAGGGDPRATLAGIDRHLREVQDGGIGFGATAYGAEVDDRALRSRSRPEVSFNYLGRTDPPERTAWRIAPESTGREFGSGGMRPTLLDVVAEVTGGRLRVGWHYDAVLLASSTVERYVAGFEAALRSLVASTAAAGSRS